MTHNHRDQPVRVVAEERPHPALAKLARACIALARLKHATPPVAQLVAGQRGARE